MSLNEGDGEILNLLNNLTCQVEKLLNSQCKICLNNNSKKYYKIGISANVCEECFNTKKYEQFYNIQKKNLRKIQKYALNKDDDVNSQSNDEQTTNETTRRITRYSIKNKLNYEQDDGSNSVTILNDKIYSNRRSTQFKQTVPKKIDISTFKIIKSEFVLHKGLYLQIDDIVSLIDDIDHKKYYAQIRGLLTDQYSQKYAIITWLLPLNVLKTNDKHEFNENAFILGPSEDIPRSLDSMEFVKRPKCDYFKHKHFVYDTGDNSIEANYINLHVMNLLDGNKTIECKQE